MKFFDSETESDDEIRQAKERLAILSPRSIANTEPTPRDYPEPVVPKTKLEKMLDIVSRKV